MIPSIRAAVLLRLAGLCAALAFSSSIVYMLNLDPGGWVLFVQLCASALFVSVVSIGGRSRDILHPALLVAIIALQASVHQRSTWTYTAVVKTDKGTFQLPEQGPFRSSSNSAVGTPFFVINDAWSIMRPDVGHATVTWRNGSDSLVVNAPMSAYFEPRDGSVRPGSVGHGTLVLLLLVWIVILLEQTWCAFRRWGLDSGHRQAIVWALFFLFGVVLIAVQQCPGTWLSNRFQSRPDDWLWYEKAAREILRGNVFLAPPPGGVEMWTALHAYLVAAFHLFLGPALSALDAVMSGIHFLLMPAFLALAQGRSLAFRLIIAAGIGLFIMVDINPLYAQRLLSDTVPLVLLVLVFIAWRRGFDRRILAVLFGVIGLQRLELLGLGPLFLLMDRLVDNDRPTPRRTLASVAILIAFIAPVALRKFVLYGNWIPFPLGLPETSHVPLDTMLSAQHIWLNLQALVGDYSVLNPELRTRFHWIPIHLLFLGAIGLVTLRRRWDRYMGFAVVAWG